MPNIISRSQSSPILHNFSTLTQLYSQWQSYNIPATFYQYFLSILKQKSKPQQISLMKKQISLLKTGQHIYLKIKSSIQARQNSLKIISKNISILLDREKLQKLFINNNSQVQNNDILGYRKLFQTPQANELLNNSRDQNRQLRQLFNHLIIYRKITLQTIFLINKWFYQVNSYGYSGLIQFIYQNNDYLQQITQKTLIILEKYKNLFEFNPFFILKKNLSTQPLYRQIYESLRISPQYAKNLYQALKLLAQHHANLLKFKILSKHSLSSSPSKKISKSSHSQISKIYGNKLSIKDHYIVKDSLLKSDRIIKKSQQKSIRQGEQNIEETYDKLVNNKLLQLSSTLKKRSSSTKNLQQSPFVAPSSKIFINPQFDTSRYNQRKYPILLKTFTTSFNKQRSNNKKIKQNVQNLKDRQSSFKTQKKYQSPYNNNNKLNIINYQHKNTLVHPININKYDYQINNGLEMEYKLKIMNELNKTRRYHQDNKNNKNATNQPSMYQYNPNYSQPNKKINNNLNVSDLQFQSKLQKSILNEFQQYYQPSKQNISQEQQNLKISIQKNIQSNNIIKYLQWVFRQQLQQSQQQQQQHLNIKNKITFQKLQSLQKILLNQRQSITIYKVHNQLKNKHNKQKQLISKQKQLVAFILCRLYKDNKTFQNTVDMKFVYMFRKSSNIQLYLKEYFSKIGYNIIKQKGEIVSKTNKQHNNNNQQKQNKKSHLASQYRAIIRCKFKLPTFSKQSQLKSVISSNQTLKMSRILKYHYYSEQSKYHKYCQHHHETNTCSISYYFQQVQKISIENRFYIKVKIDQIKKYKYGYRIWQKINNMYLFIAKQGVKQLKQYEKYIVKMEKYGELEDIDESFQRENQLTDKQQGNLLQNQHNNLNNQNNNKKIKYICFQQSKTMKKYVNQYQKPLINQYIWIENNIPQIVSISYNKQQILNKTDYLIIEQPYVLGFYGKKQDKGKSLAVMDFNQ